MLSINDPCTVADLSTDTGAAVDGAPVKGLVNPGTVIEARDRPPGMDLAAENSNPSPHYLVRIKDGAGADHDAWFCGPRVSVV